jgi:hypothetical protein
MVALTLPRTNRTVRKRRRTGQRRRGDSPVRIGLIARRGMTHLTNAHDTSVVIIDSARHQSTRRSGRFGLTRRNSSAQRGALPALSTIPANTAASERTVP